MIEINNLTANEIDEEFLRKIVIAVLEGEKIGPEVELSIAFLGPGRMRSLNRRYRRKNRVTDVLAFPESEIIFKKFKVGPFQKTRSLGEIVICLREVKKNAKRFSTFFEKELATCLIHGLLHLLGYDHERGGDEAKKMEAKQNYYLKKIGLS